MTPVGAVRRAMTVDHARLRELAIRLVASGPKACAVSASECHEISEGMIAVLEDIEAKRHLATMRSDPGARTTCVTLVSNLVVAGSLARAAFEATDHHYACVTCCDCLRKVPMAYTQPVPDWEAGGFAQLCFTCDPWIVRDGKSLELSAFEGNAPRWGE